MTVDWTKPIQTRRGEPARLLFTHCMSITTRFPRVCVIGEGTENERITTHTDDGHYSELEDPSGNDIINVPEEKVLGVINVYPESIGECHHTKAIADRQVSVGGLNRTHVVTITRCGDEVTATVEKVR